MVSPNLMQWENYETLHGVRTFGGKNSHREAHETLWDARKCTLRTERICSMRSFQSCLTKTGCMGTITWEVIVRKTKRDEWCRESSLFYCGFRLGGHVYRGDWAREVREMAKTRWTRKYILGKSTYHDRQFRQIIVRPGSPLQWQVRR